MRGSGYQRLMEDLETLDAPDAYKQVFARLIRQHAAQNGFAAQLERQERIKFAMRLLDQGEERRIIAMRLQNLFGIGHTQAYEDINKALQVVRKTTQKPDGNGVK